MVSLALWKAPTNRATGLAATTLAAGANLLSSVIDNETNLDRYMALELSWTCTTPNTVNEVIEVYLIYSLDGTNYEYGDATPKDPKKVPVSFFVDNGLATAQIQTIADVRIKPFKFKILLKSELTNTTGATLTLDVETYNEEMQ